MNTGALWRSLALAEIRALGLQKKLHQWALTDSQRQFDDLFNLICDPASLMAAWQCVWGGTREREPLVWISSPSRSIGEKSNELLKALRAQFKAQQFYPMPVREKRITKANGKC